MSRTFDVAVVGAAGMVGEAMLELLRDREFPCGKVYALDSAQNAGSKVPFSKVRTP